MIKLFAKYDDDMFITPCFESCDILNMLCGKSVQFDTMIFYLFIDETGQALTILFLYY